MRSAPARVLAEHLAAARAQGLSFDAAWPDARAAALRSLGGGDGWRAWGERFDEDADSLWRAAFERRQLGVTSAVSLLGAPLERDTTLAEMPSDVLAEALAA